jgi:A/G-specific adenine glycosylase
MSISYGDSKPKRLPIRYFQSRIVHWYQEHGNKYYWRRKNVSNYVRIISEFLLQRTNSDTINTFVRSFFSKYPNWKALSLASETELQVVLKPIGLWKRRASSLFRFVKSVCEINAEFPLQREVLEALPGVGQYIAGAILLFYHHKAEPLLDVNMARVLERFFGPRKLADIRYDPYLSKLSHKVVKGDKPQDINWAVLDHAKAICIIKNPKCPYCPLSARCLYYSRLKN